MGDFNECAYEYQNGKMVLNEKLQSIVTETLPYVSQAGLPQKSILKQRGVLLSDGSYLGPNIYMTQQSIKDGIPVYDSKIMIFHYDVSKQNNQKIYPSQDKIPQKIVHFDKDPTGGTDHAETELTVHGITFKACGYMSTEENKAFKKPIELYKVSGLDDKGNLTQDSLEKQRKCTIKLYDIFSAQFEVTKLADKPTGQQVSYFLMSLNRVC